MIDLLGLEFLGSAYSKDPREVQGLCSGVHVKHRVLHCYWAALELSKHMTFTQLIQKPQSLHSKINAFSWVSFKIYWNLDQELDPATCPHVSDPIQYHGTVYLAIGSKTRSLCIDTNVTE